MLTVQAAQSINRVTREMWLPKVMSGAYWNLMSDDGNFSTDEFCVYSRTEFSDVNAGGDFYRAELRGDNIVLIVGDVVSHGFVVSQGALVCLSAFAATDTDDPKLILEAVNRALLPIQKEYGGETFAFVMKLEKSGVCMYNGLVERATLLPMGGQTTINLQTYGSILGKADSFIGENLYFRMNDGDNLVLLTDGAANQDETDDKTSIIISKNIGTNIDVLIEESTR